MATYRNLKDLGSDILREYDIVYFGELKYNVRSSYLYSSKSSNEKIFKRLDIDKYYFCHDHYGYEPGTGDWPQSKEGDYKALTRVVKALFEIIEEKDSKKCKKPEVEESEFKVGDRVYIIPYDKCVAKGINRMGLSADSYNIYGTILEIDEDTAKVQLDNDTNLWYKLNALRPLKDYEAASTAFSELLDVDLVQTGSISVADAYETQLKMYKRVIELNKIKISSEFKFTVNKPKKVFF